MSTEKEVLVSKLMHFYIKNIFISKIYIKVFNINFYKNVHTLHVRTLLIKFIILKKASEVTQNVRWQKTKKADLQTF